MVEREPRSDVNLAEMLNDASIDRVMAIDTDWRIIAWNKTSEIITGISKKHALGKLLMEVFPQLGSDAETSTAYEFALQGKTSFLPSRADLFNRDHYENHFIPLKDDDGQIIGALNIMHDVAHRIKAERQLQQLNTALKEKYLQLEKANAEMATFTSITGQDLQEPLKKVYTSLELIMINDGSLLSNSSRAGLRRIQASLNRVKLLMDDIFAISKVSSFNGEFVAVNLNDVLRSVKVSMREKIKESQAVIEVKQLPAINGSEQMMHNLFQNLIDNAIKFQPLGHIPHITIDGSVTSTNTDKEYLCISVTDNGIGFNQADADKIFNMFERLHERSEYPGSGIGLTICRKIAETHGGYMDAESEPGKGSSFKCYLPV